MSRALSPLKCTKKMLGWLALASFFIRFTFYDCLLAWKSSLAVSVVVAVRGVPARVAGLRWRKGFNLACATRMAVI